MNNDDQDLTSGANTRLVLDGQPLGGLLGFEYAKDHENYVVGRVIYVVINANRPRAGARYRTLWVQRETTPGVWDTVFAANDIQLLTESGSYDFVNGDFVVDCKWTTNVN